MQETETDEEVLLELTETLELLTDTHKKKA